MLVSIIQINRLIGCCRNHRDLIVFCLGYTVYCHIGELIRTHHLFKPILKHQQKPLLARD